MGIIKLESFKGTAEVLGHVRSVEFIGGMLEIRDLDLADAYAILKALSVGKLITAELPTDPDEDRWTTTDKGREALAEAKVPVSASVATLLHLADQPEKVPDPSLNSPSVSDEKPPTRLTKAEVQEAACNMPLPPADLPPSEPHVVSAPSATPDGRVRDLDVLKQASKLKEVLLGLAEQGVKRVDMVGVCLAIKSQVPVLDRVNSADFVGRIERCAETYGIE
jgi:hypothetical protein